MKKKKRMMGLPLFGRGEHGFGVIPDPPEVPDCSERFIEEFCQHCSSYDECKAEYERMVDDGR